MDWTRARAILLVAFGIVNLLLAYSLWGPDATLPALAESRPREQLEQVRVRLSDRGLILPAGMSLPTTPDPMRFLRVEYRQDLTFSQLRVESYGRGQPELGLERRGFEGASTNPEPTIDPESRAVVYRPAATGVAAREVRLDNRIQVRQVAEEFLRYQLLMPSDAHLSGLFPGGTGWVVEWVPQYQKIPVYSGYTRVEVSTRGIERVAQFWVRPIGYKDSPPKAVRPAAEALLRLAGHLERLGQGTRTVLEVRLGYYAGALSVTEPELVSAWDTVPVWRITLDNGSVYYINAFNGEIES